MMSLTHKEAGSGSQGSAWAVEQQFVQYHASNDDSAYVFSPDRVNYPFGEPMPEIDERQASSLRPTLCVLRTDLFERAVQDYPAPAALRESIWVDKKKCFDLFR